MTTSAAPLLTLAEFHARYDGEKPYYELWNGEAIQKSVPIWLHNLLERILAELLRKNAISSSMNRTAHSGRLASDTRCRRSYPNRRSLSNYAGRCRGRFHKTASPVDARRALRPTNDRRPARRSAPEIRQRRETLSHRAPIWRVCINNCRSGIESEGIDDLDAGIAPEIRGVERQELL